MNQRSERLTWLVAVIAILAIGAATAVTIQFFKESHDFSCAKLAAARDREALRQLETSQRDHLLKPSMHTPTDVVHDINNYLLTVKADDKIRGGSC